MDIRRAKLGTREMRLPGSVLAAAVFAIWFGRCGGLSIAWAEDGYDCRQGYRQQRVISDFALGREWEVYASCAHPEGPRLAVMLGRESDRRAAVTPSPSSSRGSELGAPFERSVVRAGSLVSIWLNSPMARIALSGMALENGGPGVVIRVRVLPGGKVLDGFVRAADSVELVTAGFDRANR